MALEPGRLEDLASEADDILKPFGQLDVLLLYGIASKACEDYLGDRELCGKNLIPKGPKLLKRGSKMEPLTAEEMAEAVDEEFLRTRSEIKHLKDARSEITDTQEKVWRYFLPRKYSEFLYATNGEGEEKPIKRIFYDIDRGPGVSAGESLEVTREFVRFLEDDPKVQEVKDKMIVSWTGNSFHVEIDMVEGKKHGFYEEHVFTSEKEKLDTITERAIGEIKNKTDVDVIGGHEKKKEKIAIDPSQTPSGKLDRLPLGSLHMKDAETVDGLSVPVTKKELFEEDILERLRGYTPRKVVENIDELTGILE